MVLCVSWVLASTVVSMFGVILYDSRMSLNRVGVMCAKGRMSLNRSGGTFRLCAKARMSVNLSGKIVVVDCMTKKLRIEIRYTIFASRTLQIN